MTTLSKRWVSRSIFFICVTVATGLHAYSFAANNEMLEAALGKLRVTGGAPWGVTIPGIAAAVAHGPSGSLEITTAVSGVADPPGETPLSSKSRFHVGSITKTFTAALIMQLDQSGDLSLTDPISRWLEYPGGESITVEMLLGHTSGLPDFSELPEHSRTHTPHQSIALTATATPLFQPGTTWSYCNTNYIMLGVIAEKVTGTSWSQEIQSRFIERLDLKDTSIWEGHPLPNTVPGSRLKCGMKGEPDCVKKPGFRIVPVTDGSDWKVAWSAGAMVSTPADLALWIHELVNGDLLDAAHRALMATPTPQSRVALSTMPAFGKLKWTAAGLGLLQYEVDGLGTGWGHEGNINGFVANVVSMSDGRQSVAVTSNFLQTDIFTVLGELTHTLQTIDSPEN
ncbi:MAG: serine hydrolase, partial [Pirellulales bacterium]|nr:serine hydrolase [Pirellulales bacterium]